MRDYETILIKPSSSFCNINCDYCFYHDEADNRSIPCCSIMDEATVEHTLESFLPITKVLAICFQGGEPATVGLSWFMRFLEIEKPLSKRFSTTVEYSIQTNGTLIDEKWCEFFKENNFTVGVSFDGFPQLHDVHRSGTGRKVLESIRMLTRHGVKVNLLYVVTDDMAFNAPKLWEFILKNDFKYLQFIPCMDPLDKSKSFLDPKEYGRFLCYIAEQWYEHLLKDETQTIFIRLFDNFIQALVGDEPEQCGVSGTCSVQYAIEADGSIYPCDFYCLDEYCLGNVRTNTINEIDDRRAEIGFINSSITTDPECTNCRIKVLCHGGCRRYRNHDGKYKFCESYKMLMEKDSQIFRNIALSCR